jgi:long-chain acyl-CoA synthetase
MLTSGTTGLPRAAAHSVAALESRRGGLYRYWTDDRPEVNFMGLSTTGGFHTAIASLHHGQVFRAVDSINEQTMRFVAQQQITVLCGSPMQIARAGELLAEFDISLPTLGEIRMAGTAPSASLLRVLAEQPGVPIRSVYGSTEGGGVTMRYIGPADDPTNAGQPLPGTEVQIVDEAGVPVATGVEAAVRYRSPGMVSGYLEDTVVAPFPRGWFVPGDRGMLDRSGSLVLTGRNAELMNLGGLKIDPARVDEIAMTYPGVLDVAAFQIERRVGIPEIALAVVAEPECELRALDRYLREQLPIGHPTAFWRVEEIPRNRMGKVERSMLATELARRRAAQATTLI